MRRKEINEEIPQYLIVEEISGLVGPEPVLIRTTSFYPDPYKDFLDIAKEAKDRYRDRLSVLNGDYWIEELTKTGLIIGKNRKIEIKLYLRMDGEDWLLFHPNSEAPSESACQFEFENLKEARRRRNESISLSDEDYERFSDLVEAWNKMEFYYLFFQGTWNNRGTGIEKIFLHHDLQRSRQKALEYYGEKNADVAKGTLISDESSGYTVALVGKNRRDHIFYIRSTQKEMQDYLSFGLREEKQFFMSLGYSPPYG